MRTIYSSLFFICFLFAINTKAQTPALRGIYVDKFNQILGNPVKEDSLLRYAQDSAFNYFALYDLQAISFSNATTVGKLASFIRNARENYGVQYIGAVGESFSTFQNKIAPYNNGRTNVNEKFNVFNLEFEFWTASSVNTGGYYCNQYLIQNNCNCDTSGGFKFFIDQMRKIDSLATIQNALSETYLGWFNQGQGQQIAQYTDRILLHAYRTSPSSVYGYSKQRLSYLASLNQQVDVLPIFSSEPDFMGPWLDSHSMTDAYSQYIADFNSDNSTWKPYIRLLGYHWFDYTYMPKPVPGAPSSFTPVITTSGPTNFCVGGSVTLTATSGSAYVWSNGSTNSSITVNSSGSYTCQVTQNGVTGTSSPKIVTVNSAPAASIVISNSETGLVTLSSTSTAGSGTISSYQWFYNGNAIGGATSSTYAASSDGNYTLLVSNSNGCSHTSSAISISVPVSSCQLSVPGGCTSQVVDRSTVIVSWNSLSSCDSVIVRYKMENSNVYNYIRLAYTGNDMVMIPNITPNAQYSWRVKTSCGGQYSSYSSKAYFQTSYNPSLYTYSPSYRPEHFEPETEIINAEFTIYPNPAKDQLKIHLFTNDDENGEVFIMDISGRALISMPVQLFEGENSISMNTSELPSGIYFANVKTKQSHTMKRIMIQN